MSVDPAHLIDLAFDAIFVFGCETGRITFWNRGAERLYGWTAVEAIGQRPQDLLETKHPLSRDQILQILENTGQWEGALIQRGRDGTPVVVDARWALDHDRGLVLEVNRDVTAAWQSAEMLHNLERSRSEFIEQVAHQLRTPVTLLRGYAQLLEERRIVGPKNGDFENALKQIHDSADEMHRVTEQLISAARVDLEPANIHLSECNLAEITQRAIAEVSGAGADEIRYGGPSELHVVGDPNQLEMVVRELVLAGRRLSDGRTMQARTGRDGRQVSLDVVVSVAETPKGLPESLDHPRRIARLHHGDIQARSDGDLLHLELQLPADGGRQQLPAAGLDRLERRRYPWRSRTRRGA